MFGSSGDWSDVITDLQQIYTIAESYVRGIDLGLDKAFGKTADELEEELSSIEQMIKDFTDSISDLGGDIANSLIDGISNGLSQSDFLENMYEWLRKLIVQTVVYTESMKSEIEAIGKAISEGLSKGFTSDSLHEIRRDLSYIFYSANKQMAGIDSVLEGVFSGYASGTDNASRGLHLVGEAGPELVAFQGGEKVYNAAETSRMINGGNNFNVTFNNMQDTSAYAMMSQMKQWQREMAFNAVI
jgi:phage-related tail protein